MDKLITIDEKGQVLTLYADDLPKLGDTKVIRASFVDWSEKRQGWFVKLARIPENGGFGGMFLGENNATVPNERAALMFTSRSDALNGEVAFITKFVMEGH